MANQGQVIALEGIGGAALVQAAKRLRRQLRLGRKPAPPGCTWDASGTGAISGIVRNPNGDGLPDASVVATHPDRGVRREAATSENGTFSLLGLPPVPGYVLIVKSTGFADQEVTGLEVETGVETALDITLDLSPPDACGGGRVDCGGGAGQRRCLPSGP